LAAHREAFAVLILHYQDSIPNIFIEPAVADEVKDMNILPT
jgi:hypothetical protein